MSFYLLPVERSNPRKSSVYVPPRLFDVPYVPTRDAVVSELLRLARVTPGDTVYDLGCGDGRIVIAAARDFGARGVGIDADPARIAEAVQNARRAGVAHRLSFRQQSFFDADVSPATVVTLFLLNAINLRLRPMLLAQLRPGARIVANFFDMGDWKPDQTVTLSDRTLHRWVVPARVTGHWKCVLLDPATGRQRHAHLDLERRFQQVVGTARLDGKTIPIQSGRVTADTLTFSTPARTFTARIQGHTARGHCLHDGHALPWGGIRD